MSVRSREVARFDGEGGDGLRDRVAGDWARNRVGSADMGGVPVETCGEKCCRDRVAWNWNGERSDGDVWTGWKSWGLGRDTGWRSWDEEDVSRNLGAVVAGGWGCVVAAGRGPVGGSPLRMVNGPVGAYPAPRRLVTCFGGGGAFGASPSYFRP